MLVMGILKADDSFKNSLLSRHVCDVMCVNLAVVEPCCNIVVV